jgi:hypothetical protein
MLRTALAVAVAAALLGLALPVVDDARVGHADSQVRTELGQIESAAADLRTTSDPVGPGAPGGRVTHSLRLPGATWGTAGVERVRVPAHPNGSVRWQVAGGRTKTITPTPPLVAPPDGLVLRDPGRHRLTLRLRRYDGTVVVVVSRADV